jgi:hypothetical protein
MNVTALETWQGFHHARLGNGEAERKPDPEPRLLLQPGHFLAFLWAPVVNKHDRCFKTC